MWKEIIKDKVRNQKKYLQWNKREKIIIKNPSFADKIRETSVV